MDVMLWAKTAGPGERVVYAQRPGDSVFSNSGLLRLAAQAHAAGLVFLAQRRTERGWDYEATRISPLTVRKLELISREKYESSALNRVEEVASKRRYVKGSGR